MVSDFDDTRLKELNELDEEVEVGATDEDEESLDDEEEETAAKDPFATDADDVA